MGDAAHMARQLGDGAEVVSDHPVELRGQSFGWRRRFRLPSGARLEVHQPWYREKLGAVFTWLVGELIAPVSDATCGFKAYRGDIGRELFDAVRIYDWSFDAELLFIARKRGYRMTEIAVTWKDMPGSNVRILRDIVRSLIGLARIRLHGARGLHEHACPSDVHLEVWRTPEP